MSKRLYETFIGPIACVGLVAVLALAVIATSLLPAARAATKSAPCGDSTTGPRHLSLHQMQASELCLINRVRVHFGLHPLVFNPDLRDSATAHSVSMVVHDYFDHEGPGGSMDSRIARAGYVGGSGSYSLGEDIGGGGGPKWGSPMAVFKSWMHSPPHRENILDPNFRDFGVGVARGYPIGRPAGAATYTADFGSRSG